MGFACVFLFHVDIFVVLCLKSKNRSDSFITVVTYLAFISQLYDRKHVFQILKFSVPWFKLIKFKVMIF